MVADFSHENVGAEAEAQLDEEVGRRFQNEIK